MLTGVETGSLLAWIEERGSVAGLTMQTDLCRGITERS
jgi:hypothetical protein